MTTSRLLEKRVPDRDNQEDARTIFTFEGAVRLDIEVARDSAARRRGLKAPFVANVGWGSRSGLTLDEAEEFANALLEGVGKARADIERRNGV